MNGSWVLEVTTPNGITTLLPLAGGRGKTRRVKKQLEQALEGDSAESSVLREALSELSVVEIAALRTSGAFSDQRLYDAAPVPMDLTFYWDSLLWNGVSGTEAANRVKRLEQLLLRDLGWRDWGMVNLTQILRMIAIMPKSEAFAGEPVALLVDMAHFLGWLRDFPEVPKSLRKELDILDRTVGLIQKQLSLKISEVRRDRLCRLLAGNA